MKPAARRSAAARLLALGAIALWGTLAWLGVRLAAVPPFLLVGTALTAAGVLASPTWRQWRVPPRALALGVYGLFGFHFFLFVALRFAPPVPANLINYLWPLLIVLLAPAFVADAELSRRHVAGAVLGFAGALFAITGGRLPHGFGTASSAALPGRGEAIGYACALLSAFVWATYSLYGQRLRRQGVVYRTAAIGLFCLVSGVLSLACHAMLEEPYRFATSDYVPLAALAIGPMGLAFFFWDAALVRGDAREIGTLAYLTPLVSTILLALGRGEALGWPIALALIFIVGGAAVGTRHARP